jgi:hypothetical protein
LVFFAHSTCSFMMTVPGAPVAYPPTTEVPNDWLARYRGALMMPDASGRSGYRHLTSASCEAWK